MFVRIRRLIDTYSAERRLLSKATVAIYESVQEFWVAATGDGTVVGCGALHVMWEDLAEIRTVAVDPARRGHKIGHRIVSELLATAAALGVRRVFCLTFETAFFGVVRVHADRRRAGAAQGLRGAAPLVRRGRRRVPGPRTGQAEHARQHPHAAASGSPMSTTHRVAAIDCGTNSIRLLVADLPADRAGRLADLVRRDGDRPAGRGRRPDRPAGPGRDRAHPGRAGRITPLQIKTLGAATGTHGGHLRHPRRAQRRRLPGHGAAPRSAPSPR